MRIVGHANSRSVSIDGKWLSPAKSQKVRNHSPDGFNWGYGGSGPAQLALAILLEVLPRADAERWYQDFKWQFIGRLSQNQDFTLDVDIKSWIAGGETANRVAQTERL